MALFAAMYTYAPELADKREANKPAHREWLAARVDEGSIVTVGPFTDGGGAMLVVNAADVEEARTLLAQDPHTTEGLIAETRVREWTPVFGLLS